MDSEPTILTLVKGLHARMDRQDQTLNRIEEQAIKSNSRLTKLETKEAISNALGERAEKERAGLQSSKQDRGDRRSAWQAAIGGGVAGSVVYVVGHALHLI